MAKYLTIDEGNAIVTRNSSGKMLSRMEIVKAEIALCKEAGGEVMILDSLTDFQEAGLHWNVKKSICETFDIDKSKVQIYETVDAKAHTYARLKINLT